jgi:hypothetical protein
MWNERYHWHEKAGRKDIKAFLIQDFRMKMPLSLHSQAEKR